jgi:hypothetical protein
MHQTTDITLFNWRVVTFIETGNKRKSKRTRRNKKPFKPVLPTIHENAKLLLSAMISDAAPTASRNSVAAVRASYRNRVPKSDLFAFFKRRRIAAEQIKNKKQRSSSTTIWV